MTAPAENALTPEITVVIPAWNVGDELTRAIKSVQTQNVPTEILLIDNDSQTPLHQPENVTIHRLEKRVNVGVARNIGLQKAATKYVLFLDADEALRPNALGFLKKELDEHRHYIMVAGRIAIKNTQTGHEWEDEIPNRQTDLLTRLPALVPYFEALKFIMPKLHIPVTGTTLHRTEIAKTSPGYAESRFAQDIPFSLSMVSRGRVKIIDQPVKTVFRPKKEYSLTKAASKDPNALAKAIEVLYERARTDSRIPWLTKYLIQLNKAAGLYKKKHF